MTAKRIGTVSVASASRRAGDWRNLLPALAWLLLAAGCERPAADSPKPAAVTPPAVKTTPLATGEIARSLVLPAYRLVAIQEATLYSKVSGYLKSLAVDKGDSVKEGQILAEIEVPELLADQKQFSVEAQVARTNHDRMTAARLKAPDLVVPETVENLRGLWQVAEARLQRTESLLQFSHITAPFAGLVTARFVDPGAYVPAATSGNSAVALVTLMDFSRLRVQVFIPEAEVPLIKNGLPAKLTVEELPGRDFSGTVTRFSYALDQASKTMLAEIEMPNPKGELRPGMYGSVQIEVERKKEASLLPVGAVLVEKSGTSVFLLAEGKARKTVVRTGFNDGTKVEILDGIKAGQPVILIGKLILNDGQAVTTSEAK